MPIPRPSHANSRLPAALLWRLRHRPLGYWVAAGALAAITGVVVSNVIAAAEADRSRLGAIRPALVAVRAMPAGHRLTVRDVEVRSLPSAALPDGALDEPAPGEILAVPVVRGDVLSIGKLAPEGLGPVAGLLPPGTRGLAIPDGGAGLRLAPGDVVDVLTTFPPATTTGRDPTFAVAEGAVVVDVVEEAVTVAVREQDAPRVAFALTQGIVTLALSGHR